MAKEKEISLEETKVLKNKGLIEGRRPNYHISPEVAEVTGEMAVYIKQKGLDDVYYEELIMEYLRKFNSAASDDLKELLIGKFPDKLDSNQKENKLRNMLQKMKRKNLIKLSSSRKWVLV